MSTNDLLQEALNALTFYANPENWDRGEHSFSSASLPSSAMLDEGNIARKAIEMIKRQKEEESR